MQEKLWVAVEGPDMVGKATQSQLLRDAFLEAGHSAIVVEVPFFGSKLTYNVIYSMLKSGAAMRWPLLFQLVHFVNKFTCQVAASFMPERVIIFDRWHLSSVVYGEASGVSRRFAVFLSKLLVKPDVTVVLSRDSQHQRDEDRDSYESDRGLQDRVRQIYREACDGVDVILVDADGTRAEVAGRVSEAVATAAAKRNAKIGDRRHA